MIRIGDKIINELSTIGNSSDPVKRLILQILSNSTKVYSYPVAEELIFELNLRSAIVQSALDLNASRMKFATFAQSKCNEAYWTRTQEGGFRQKSGVSAYRAIQNILEDSGAYATECATAIVIVFYLALTRVLSENVFNRLFSPIYLMDWKYLDKDLGIQSYKNVKDPLPGDCLYIENPDYDPETPEWRGENVIMLGNDRYYGHGIGIRSIEGFIQVLNRKRVPGSNKSAYLSSGVVRPNYRYLYLQSRT